MSVERDRQALLETLALAVAQHDKGVLEPELFGRILEKLQAYLESEEAERLNAPAGECSPALPNC